MNANEPTRISVRAAADRFKVPHSALRAAVDARELSYFQYTDNGTVYLDPEEVEAWLATKFTPKAES